MFLLVFCSDNGLCSRQEELRTLVVFTACQERQGLLLNSRVNDPSCCSRVVTKSSELFWSGITAFTYDGIVSLSPLLAVVLAYEKFVKICFYSTFKHSIFERETGLCLLCYGPSVFERPLC